MKTVATSVLLTVLGQIIALGVQPFPGGVRIAWDRQTNDINFFIWRLNPPSTNWVYLGTTVFTNFLYTNTVLEGTMFGVTVNQKMSNGACCVASDVGVAGWPPALGTPPKTVKLTPTNGFMVATGRWMKVSSDLKTHEDWLRFTIPSPPSSFTNFVRVEHMTSPLKPHLFIEYPTNPTPPFP
jgi:hypothetical protein